MKVQLHTDKHVAVDAELITRIEASVAEKLARFDDHLTRVEVHLTDQSAGKRVGADIRCLVEARPSGRPPVAVSHDAPNVAEALEGATEKVVALLGHLSERVEDRGGRETIRKR